MKGINPPGEQCCARFFVVAIKLNTLRACGLCRMLENSFNFQQLIFMCIHHTTDSQAHRSPGFFPPPPKGLYFIDSHSGFSSSFVYSIFIFMHKPPAPLPPRSTGERWFDECFHILNTKLYRFFMRPMRDVLINRHTTNTNQHTFTTLKIQQIPALLIKMTVHTKAHMQNGLNRMHRYICSVSQMTPCLVLCSTAKFCIEFMVCTIHTMNNWTVQHQHVVAGDRHSNAKWLSWRRRRRAYVRALSLGICTEIK